MPINARYRWFYPIDWPQLSAVIRFKRAQGKCEGCGRPHGHTVCHLGDGRWWDRDKKQWRDGKGRPLPRLPALWLWKGTIRTLRLAALADAAATEQAAVERAVAIVLLPRRLRRQRAAGRGADAPGRARGAVARLRRAEFGARAGARDRAAGRDVARYGEIEPGGAA